MKKFYRICAIILSVCVLSLCALFASCTKYCTLTGEIKIAQAYRKAGYGFFVDQETAIVLQNGETEAYMEIEYDGNEHIPIGRVWFRAYYSGGNYYRWMDDSRYIYSSIWKENGPKDALLGSICEKGVYRQVVYYRGQYIGEQIVSVTVVIK